MIELAAPDIGTELAGRKKFNSAATDFGKKTLRKQLGGEKPRKRILFENAHQKSVDAVELGGKFFETKMNTRSTNDSNFHYGHLTNSCLEIFEEIPVLEPIESSRIQEVYPSTSLDESSIEFEFETDRSVSLDMRDSHLQIKVGLQKGKLFEDFMEKEEHEKPDIGMTFTNGLYGHKALISNDFNASTTNNEGILACHGYEFEKDPSDYEKSPFLEREEELFVERWDYLIW